MDKEKFLKIVNLGIALILATPMFLLSVPFYVYNKIRGKV